VTSYSFPLSTVMLFQWLVASCRTIYSAAPPQLQHSLFSGIASKLTFPPFIFFVTIFQFRQFCTPYIAI